MSDNSFPFTANDAKPNPSNDDLDGSAELQANQDMCVNGNKQWNSMLKKEGEKGFDTLNLREKYSE